jgi:hypothetical protein
MTTYPLYCRECEKFICDLPAGKIQRYKEQGKDFCRKCALDFLDSDELNDYNKILGGQEE